MGGLNLYRKQDSDQLSFEDFNLPFGGKLSSNNRWILLSKVIPWDQIEEKYSDNFKNSKLGAPAKSARTAFATIFIQEHLNLTDRETLSQIEENPYLQYFIGFNKFQLKPPFDTSLLVHFRKRFNKEMLSEINEEIIKIEFERKKENKKDLDDEDQNSGKMIADATCTPADIKFPTDLSILNEAREKCEKIIDVLHKPLIGLEPKVRTYRKNARKDYLKLAKRKKLKSKEIRKGIGKQLRYINRDLEYIEELSKKSTLTALNKQQYKNLLVIHEVYRQQELMYRLKTHKMSGRIVSISQPHIRPIVRGKAGVPVEFGAKISISVVDGYTRLDKLSWEPYNESQDLETQIENYKEKYGVYPESVHVDKIYLTRGNRKYCKDHEIRLSGKALGRPKKNTDINELKEIKKQTKEDFIYRIAVEGKIGQSKRRFGLDKVMTKLASTSETVIAMVVLIMNLEKLMKSIFFGSFFQQILLYFKKVFCTKLQYRTLEKNILLNLG